MTAFWDRDNDNVDDGASEFDDTGTVVWDDLTPLVTTATLSQTEVSTQLGAFTTITATVQNAAGCVQTETIEVTATAPPQSLNGGGDIGVAGLDHDPAIRR